VALLTTVGFEAAIAARIGGCNAIRALDGVGESGKPAVRRAQFYRASPANSALSPYCDGMVMARAIVRCMLFS